MFFELLDLRQCVVDHVGFRPALVLGEVCKELFLRFIRIRNEFLAGTEGQPANIAICNAGRCPHKPHYLHVSLGHNNMMAGTLMTVNGEANAVLRAAVLVTGAVLPTGALSVVPLFWRPLRMGGEQSSANSYLVCHHKSKQQA